MFTDVAPITPLVVLRAFAPGRHNWSPGHRGIDIRTRPGQPIRAPRSGTVTFTGRVGGKDVVVVRHGSTRTTLQPVRAKVPVGRTVTAGDRLGVVTFGGHCPTSCVHWGLRRGRKYLNPLSGWDQRVLKPMGGSAGAGRQARGWAVS